MQKLGIQKKNKKRIVITDRLWKELDWGTDESKGQHMAHLWNRWRVHSVGEIPSRWPMRRPMAAIVEAASSLQPPRDSTTSGMKVTPAERHASAWAAMINQLRNDTRLVNDVNLPRICKRLATSAQQLGAVNWRNVLTIRLATST